MLQQAKKLIKEEQEELGCSDENVLSLKNFNRTQRLSGLPGILNHDQDNHISSQQNMSPSQKSMSLDQNSRPNSAVRVNGLSTNGSSTNHKMDDRYTTNNPDPLDIQDMEKPAYSSPDLNNLQKSPQSHQPMHGGHTRPPMAPIPVATSNGDLSTENIPQTSIPALIPGGEGGVTSLRNVSDSITNHTSSSSIGSMMSSHMMAAANLIPYPHSIFPSSAYMLNAPPPPHSSVAENRHHYHHLSVPPQPIPIRQSQ